MARPLGWLANCQTDYLSWTVFQYSNVSIRFLNTHRRQSEGKKQPLGLQTQGNIFFYKIFLERLPETPVSGHK